MKNTIQDLRSKQGVLIHENHLLEEEKQETNQKYNEEIRLIRRSYLSHIGDVDKYQKIKDESKLGDKEELEEKHRI